MDPKLLVFGRILGAILNRVFAQKMICVGMLLWGVPFTATAQQSSQSSSVSELANPPGLNTSTGANFTQLRANKLSTKNKIKVTAVAESQQYAAAVPGSPDLSQSQFLSLGVDYKFSGDSFKLGADAALGTFFKKDQTHYAVYDLFAETYRGESGWMFSAGRQRKGWSDLDAYNNFGAWQPKFALDPLRTRQQGLSGFFGDFESENVDLLVLYSPINIPSVNPDIREEDGTLVSDSRWNRPTSKTYRVVNNDKPIVYNLKVGDLSKLINHQGYAAKLKLKDRSGLFADFAWGLKPMNEIILRRDAFAGTTDARVVVKLEPDVGMHEVSTVEAGYKTQRLAFVVSNTIDLPREKLPEEDQWVLQNPLKANISGVLLKVNPFREAERMELALSYAKITGGEIVDLKKDGTRDEITIFDKRYLFYDSFKMSADSEIKKIGTKTLRGYFSYLYDQQQKGSLMTAEMQFIPNPLWAVHIGVNVLGVEQESDDTTFINQFRANDRVYGGLNYVF